MEKIFTGVNVYSVPIFFVILAAREFFTYKNNKLFKYLLTPLVMISVIFTASMYLHTSGENTYIIFIFLGLVFSLVADVLLMIIEVRMLLYGLVFFLVAHVLYIFAFSTRYDYQSWHPLFLIILIVPMGFFFNILRKKAGRMKIPVFVYMIIITMMVFLSITGIHEGSGRRSYLAAAGAVLFLISDIILAVNEFVREIPHSSVFVWSVYAPGQMLLALSCG